MITVETVHTVDSNFFFSGTTEVPKVTYIGLVETKSQQGDIKSSPFRFSNFQVQSITISKDSELLPSPVGFRDLVWSGPNMNYNKAYFSLYDYDSKVNLGTSIDLRDYPSSFCLYKFSNGYLYTEAHDHLELPRVACNRLSIIFHPNSDNPSLQCMVYTEKSANIAITGAREILKDY